MKGHGNLGPPKVGAANGFTERAIPVKILIDPASQGVGLVFVV